MKSLSLKNKILIACLSWGFLLLFSTVFIFFNQNQQERILTQLGDSRVRTSEVTKLINIMILMETGIRGYLLAGTEDYLQPFSNSEALFDKQIEMSLAGSHSEDYSQKLKDVQAEKQRWMESIADEMIAKKKADRNIITYQEFVAKFREGKGKVFSDKVQSQLNFLLEEERLKNEELGALFQSASQKTRLLIIFFLPTVIIVGIILMVTFISRTTSKLNDITTELSQFSQKMLSTTSDVSEITKTISEGALDQSEALESATSSMVEISSIVKLNSDKADAAKTASTSSVTIGKQTAENTLELHRSTQELKQSAKKISDIIVTVDEIAFQTNLLSLNASVEAARAGEQGRGFAVVADSIRALSKRAADSTKEISNIVHENFNMTEMNLKKLETSKNNIESLISSLDKIDLIIHDVALGGREQSKGVDQMTTKFSQIDEALQKNSEAAKSSGDIVNDLNTQSEQLVTLVERMNVLVRGNSSGSSRAA